MTASRFDGGVHPDDMKSLSADAAICDFPLPDQVNVPLSQHIGAPAKPVVAKGDRVAKGQVIGEPGAFVSTYIHAPVSGAVTRLGTAIHPLGHTVPSVLIERDADDDAWAEGANVEWDWRATDADAIKDRVLKGGLCGMGGATFPTHVKLSPPPDKPIDTVILNGVECEPYLTADYRLMLEDGAPIVEGLEIVMKIVGAGQGIIAIEANKPDAVEKIQALAKDLADVRVAVLPVRYPQGAEKQLIKALLGREVPSGGLPMDVGAVVQNVGTAHAITEAVRYGRPLIERVVTVTGAGVARPANFRCRVGAPLRALIDACGRAPDVNKIVSGGPMMGLAQRTDDVPVTKGTSGVLVLVGAERHVSHQCIRCGRCVETCPMRLVPSTLSILAETEDFDATMANHVLDCIECGCCAYVCPARRPIVHQVKFAKAQLTAKKRAADAEAKKAETKKREEAAKTE